MPLLRIDVTHSDGWQDGADVAWNLGDDPSKALAQAIHGLGWNIKTAHDLDVFAVGTEPVHITRQDVELRD